MRTLTDTKIPLAIWAGYFRCMQSTVFMTCYNNHKIFNSVIALIFNRTRGKFSSLVMNQFPRMKVTSKMFSHYKTMFRNITSFISHRIEKIIRRNPNKNITFFCNLPTAFPARIFRARTLFASTTALLAMKSLWLPPIQYYPSLFTATNASVPNILIESASRFCIDPIGMYIFGSSYFSQFRHNYIIPPAHKSRKGGK